MAKFLKRSNWLTGILILTMPISLIYFLGSQMAHGQVQARYNTYSTLPEFSRLIELQSVAEGEVVLLRGQIVDVVKPLADQSLIIYQERPLDGREVRFREEFQLVAPEFILGLADGTVVVQPGDARERTISHESRRVVDNDRELTGFQIGDMVTLQGTWQPVPDAQEGSQQHQLVDITGISGAEKATLLAEVQAALQQVSRARNWLGLLTLLSIGLLALQLYRRRKSPSYIDSDAADHLLTNDSPEEEVEKREWHPPINEPTPTS